MTIKEAQKACHSIARDKGWWDEPREIGTLIALMHSELSEGLEAHRTGNIKGKDGLEEELADTVIRILDFCGGYHLDLQGAIQKKMEYNKKRSYKHGGKEY